MRITVYEHVSEWSTIPGGTYPQTPLGCMQNLDLCIVIVDILHGCIQNFLEGGPRFERVITPQRACVSVTAACSCIFSANTRKENYLEYYLMYKFLFKLVS